ncbi:flagellar hook capping FlgD N-terminal domain-containing protein [uncultured Roseobacter sp.]|uniref:flagellar hook capping FlgD N-terminal domain-containing protein n=1 Tax=uncultured Roseobacter sp. TaxID=114847 RepID=UPI00262BFD38|nr:flagellar hook capping FlgD N-terminal domain-containing protein [uncultured Roseobacter sp.]
MEVNTITTAQNQSATADTSSQAASVISSDFETFLQMLTAQARYQDPLEPIDSSEYAAQLAQFSMVEQQVLSNDLLTELSNRLGAGNIAEMAGWIGMEARTTAPVRYDGSPITVVPAPETGAEEVVLVVYDETGEEVQRQQIATGTDPIEWDGTAPGGSELAPGVYSFAVESRSLGEVTATTAAESYARITEARRQGSETLLILNSGAAVSTSQIAALRDSAVPVTESPV